LEQNGTAGNYTLTATVYGVGGSSPTGLVSFLNSSNENAVLSTAALTTGDAGFNFVNAQNQAAGGGPSSVTVGDFNRDGIPDLAMSSGAVLLGKEDGTFTESPDLPSKVVYSGNFDSMVSRDFNGDGFLDLAIPNTNNNNVTVLMVRKTERLRLLLLARQQIVRLLPSQHLTQWRWDPRSGCNQGE
jgi:hypothetical protein